MLDLGIARFVRRLIHLTRSDSLGCHCTCVVSRCGVHFRSSWVKKWWSLPYYGDLETRKIGKA